MDVSDHFGPCALCPRRCGADRRSCAGQCGMPATPILSRAALHHREELSISGRNGSGTVLFSLMRQFIPLHKTGQYPALNRLVRDSEIRTAVRYMEALGLEGYTQELSSATHNFIPAFDNTGL